MPNADEQFTLTVGVPAARLAELITETRLAAGLDYREVAKAVGTNVRRVKRWEKGEEIPTDEALTLIAATCGSSIDMMLPPRDRVEYDRSSLLMRVGDAVVSIVDPDNEVVLTTYLRLVRQQRGLWPDDEVHLRRSDIDMLSTVLDLRDDALEERLVTFVGLTPEAAAELRFQMIRRRHPSAG
jgi:transcriptional regulator with XRE-family HTH domain